MHDEDLYAFGSFVLDSRKRVLARGAEPLRLTPREVDVLVALVERHGELVEKSEFFDRVWRGLAVEECNLSQHVAALRRVLHDDARVPTYIETVPRRGYRFVAPVARIDRSSAPVATPVPSSSPVPFQPPHEPAPSEPPEAPVEAPPPALAESDDAPAPAPGRGRPVRRATAALGVATAVALGVAWWMLRAGPRRAPPDTRRSIAVQPFANLTGDAHQDRMAETLTAALMKDLAAVDGLRVEPASLPGKGGPQPAGVDAVVETSLLAGEGRVRLTAELIDARTRRLIWADAFDTDPVSFLDTEARIAREIVARLDGAAVSGGEADRAAAHQECVLAQEYLSRRTPQVVREALAHFTAAAERDRAYAPALVGVAKANLLGVEQRVLTPEEALAGAEAAARRALELNPRLAEAHAALGEVAAARWDFEGAEASYLHALSLDPAIASVHEKYAALLTVRDRHEQAVAEARVARDLDPACPAAATALAAAYYHSGQTDAAIEQALAALRLTPRFPAAYDVLGWAYQAKGQDAEALAAFAEAVRLSDGSPTYVAALARAHARGGDRAEARRLLADLERRARERRASRLDLAEVLAALGETDKALRQVERAVAEGAPWLQHVDAGLRLSALHDHARFRALVDRMRHAGASEDDEPGAAGTGAVSAPLAGGAKP